MSTVARPHVVTEPFHQRQHPPEQLDALFCGGWPAWIDADREAARHLPTIRSTYGHLEVVLLVDDVLTAAAWGVPIPWNGTAADLPSGYSSTLARAVEAAEPARGASPRFQGAAGYQEADTLVVCAAQVRPDATGRGIASTLLNALIDIGAQEGLSAVLAPLRPTGKHRYPLTGIAEYASWRRPDGSAFDPWLRTHERMGARVLSTTTSSQVFEATIEQWQDWTGLALPATGDYVVPQGPAVLQVDADAGTGTLREPGIWVQHR